MLKTLVLLLLLTKVVGAQTTPVDGSWTALETPNLPNYAAAVVGGAQTYTWQNGTTTWYSASSFTVKISITDGRSHVVSFYMIDYDMRGRAETISNGTAIQTAQNFSTGMTVNFTIPAGISTTTYTFTNISASAPNAVLTKMSFATPAPVCPAPVHSVTLAWQAVPGATTYNVYRNGTILVTGIALVVGAPNPFYKDASVAPGASYTYATTSVANGMESAKSPLATVTIPTP